MITYRYETLSAMVEAQEMSNRVLADKAGVSFRVITEVGSGTWEQEIFLSKWSKRKKERSFGATMRLIVACDESPDEWIERLELTRVFSRSVIKRLLREATDIKTEKTSRWHLLDSIADEPITEADIEKLMKGMELGEDFFTIEMAIRLLIANHK